MQTRQWPPSSGPACFLSAIDVRNALYWNGSSLPVAPVVIPSLRGSDRRVAVFRFDTCWLAPLDVFTWECLALRGLCACWICAVFPSCPRCPCTWARTAPDPQRRLPLDPGSARSIPLGSLWAQVPAETMAFHPRAWCRGHGKRV